MEHGHSTNTPVQKAALLALILALVGFAVGLSARLQPPPGPPRGPVHSNPAALSRRYPGSMADWVADAEIIVGGTVTGRSFLGWTTKYFTGPDDTLVIEAPDEAAIKATAYVEITAETEEGNQVIRMDITHLPWQAYSSYTLRVDQIYKGDGIVRVGDEVPLYRPGTLELGRHAAYTPPMNEGETFLFALKKQPDGIHYGVSYSGSGCLSLGDAADGSGVVMEMWNEPTVVSFTDSTTVRSFLAELEETVGR